MPGFERDPTVKKGDVGVKSSPATPAGLYRKLESTVCKS